MELVWILVTLMAKFEHTPSVQGAYPLVSHNEGEPLQELVIYPTLNDCEKELFAVYQKDKKFKMGENVMGDLSIFYQNEEGFSSYSMTCTAIRLPKN